MKIPSFRILEFVSPSLQLKFRLTLCLGVLAALTEAFAMFTIMFVIQMLLTPGSQSYGVPSSIRVLIEKLGFNSSNELSFVFGLALLVFILKSVLAVYFLHKQATVVWQLRNDLSNKVLAKKLEASSAKYGRVHHSEHLKNVLADVEIIANNFLVPSLTIFSELMVTSLILLVLFFLFPFQTFVITGFLCFVMLLYRKAVRPLVIREGEARLEAEEKRYLLVDETLYNKSLITIWHCKNFFTDLLGEANKANGIANARLFFLQQSPKYLMELIAISMLFSVYIASAAFGKDKNEILVLAAAYCVAAFRVLPSFSRLITATTLFRSAQPVIKLVRQVLSQETPQNRPSLVKDPMQHIEFCNVSFVDQFSKQIILKDLDLTIQRGEFISIVGPSGSGKSTFINLLMGISEPSTGEIKINGVPAVRMANYDLVNFSYLPQDFVICTGSALSKINFGHHPEFFDGARLRPALENSMADRILSRRGVDLNDALDNLSGGEKQKLAIARTLYRDFEVLILDEPTSSMDETSERIIFDNIASLRGETTVVIITHNERLISISDRVIRFGDQTAAIEALENGK